MGAWQTDGDGGRGLCVLDEFMINIGFKQF